MDSHSHLTDAPHEVIRALDDPTVHCECVKEHRPDPDEYHVHHVQPLAMGGPDVPENKVVLCPTTHSNVHMLLRKYVHAKGDVPWPVRRRYNRYTQYLALEGWRRYVTSKGTT